MDLYLMRHGAALTKEEARVPEDAQRPLSPEGWATVRRVADGLQLGIDLFDYRLR